MTDLGISLTAQETIVLYGLLNHEPADLGRLMGYYDLAEIEHDLDEDDEDNPGDLAEITPTLNSLHAKVRRLTARARAALATDHDDPAPTERARRSYVGQIEEIAHRLRALADAIERHAEDVPASATGRCRSITSELLHGMAHLPLTSLSVAAEEYDRAMTQDRGDADR